MCDLEIARVTPFKAAIAPEAWNTLHVEAYRTFGGTIYYSAFRAKYRERLTVGSRRSGSNSSSAGGLLVPRPRYRVRFCIGASPGVAAFSARR